MTNEELVRLIQSGTELQKNEELLFLNCKKLISNRARRFLKYDSLEDLEQAGYIGFHEAIGKYSQDRGGKFITYAVYYIDNAIRQYVQSCGATPRFPAYVWEKVARLNMLRVQILTETGKDASAAQLAYKMHMTLSEMQALLKAEKALSPFVSLDKPIDEDGNTLSDVLLDPNNKDDEIIEKESIAERDAALWASVDSLPVESAKLIRRIYCDGQRIEDIAVEQHRTRNSVYSELRNCYREILKHKAIRPYREEFLNEYTSAVGFHGGIKHFMERGSIVEEIAIQIHSGELDHLIEEYGRENKY